MNARTINRRYPRATAVAIAVPYNPAFEFTSLGEQLSQLRDTIIVLSMQIAFRVTTLLRHLNY
jgi:predicted short-subunit dehydrogenase-like oxidoreductase (DUF2520 family)